MEYNKGYNRRDDDSTNSILRIIKIESGEVQLRIHDWDTMEEMIVGFATLIGGGRSPNTRKALENLALAIEKDNQENPLPEWEERKQEEVRKNVLTLNKMKEEFHKE